MFVTSSSVLLINNAAYNSKNVHAKFNEVVLSSTAGIKLSFKFNYSCVSLRRNGTRLARSETVCVGVGPLQLPR